MGNKIITEKDFWMCEGGNVPAQLQSTQLSTKKKDGKKYITLSDTATSSMMDFGCNKLMLIMAIVAAVIAVCVVATGGAALIAIGALAGAAGAAVGAVMGGLICGQIAAMARIWLGSKSNMIVQGKPAITGDHQMQCMLFGDKITFAPNIKNWWQAIALGGANYIGGIMEGIMAGAAVGMGGAFIGGARTAFLQGGTRAVGQAGLNFLKAVPSNIMTNFGQGLFNGAGFKARDGVTNWLNTYGETGTARVDDFKKGVQESTFGDVNAVKSIATTGGTAQDWLAVGMLIMPGGKKGVDTHNNSHIASPDAPNNKKPKADEPNLKPKTNAPESNTKPKKEGEAFEASPVKEPGSWEQRTTPDKGAEYQQKVTGKPKDTEYVVKTNRMKSGEKKFDGYDPETNTLIDAKDWDGWPPSGESKFDNFARNKELENIKKDSQIAADNEANLEYHVPSEAKKNQLLEMLGDDIPENFDIKVTPKN